MPDLSAEGQILKTDVRTLLRHLAVNANSGVLKVWECRDHEGALEGLLIYRGQGYPTPIVVWFDDDSTRVVYLVSDKKTITQDIDTIATDFVSLRERLERALRF